MNFLAIKHFGFVIKTEEFRELILNSIYKDTYIDTFGNVENGKELNKDYEFMCDLASGIGLNYFSADNELGLVLYGLKWREKIFELNCGGVFLLPFDKDNLFEQYESYEEIYSEVLYNLKNEGINVDKDFVEKHCGLLEGVDFCD